MTQKRENDRVDPVRQQRAATSALAAVAVLLAGCSIKNIAIKELGSALSEGTGGAFAEEADLEFAGQAIPFSLKLVESLLHEQPENTELLLAAASGFTQYSKAWVEQPADFIENDDFSEAQKQRERAKAFYLRAYDYGLRGLNAEHPGFSTRFRADPQSAAADLGSGDIDLAYWTAAALGSAVSLSRTDPEMIAQLPAVEALADRAFQLEPDWNHGALHEMMMSLELSRTSGGGDSRARVLEHFERAVELTHERSASPYVSLAELISIQEQNREQFVSLLNKALAIDPNAHPENRLANVVAQKRASWLLSRVDDLFLE